MNRIATLSLLRQCTGSVSSPAVARRSAARALALRVGLRPYSTQNGQNGAQEEKKENGNGQGEEAAAAAEKKDDDRSQAGAAVEEEAVDPECMKKLKAKEEEVVDLTSRLRYLQADFLNLQRNAAREKEQTKDFAITRFAGDLLETVDVLSLALKSVPESALKAVTEEGSDAPSQPASDSSSSSESASSSTSASMSDSSTSTTPSPSPSDSSQSPKSASEYLRELHHGVEMTHRLLLSTLFKYGVKPFDPTGDPFDPNRHEALYQFPVPGKKPGTVVDCQKTGYTIKERTLRAAQVGVASEGSGQSSQS